MTSIPANLSKSRFKKPSQMACHPSLIGYFVTPYGQDERNGKRMRLFLTATGSVLAMLFIFWMIVSKDKFLSEELNKSPWEGDK